MIKLRPNTPEYSYEAVITYQPGKEFPYFVEVNRYTKSSRVFSTIGKNSFAKEKYAVRWAKKLAGQARHQDVDGWKKVLVLD